MNPLNTLAQEQITAYITAWANIPVSLTENSPISYTNGAGLSLADRLSTFTAQVRAHEEILLQSLGVSQSFLDDFLKRSNQYRLLFWQLPLAWVKSDKDIANRVMHDMEGLGISLRKLEKAMPRLNAEAQEASYDAPLTVGREINHLRRLLASRASFAEELLPVIEKEPAEALMFFDENLRCMRRLEPMVNSLEFYYSRRPSYRPPSAV